MQLTNKLPWGYTEGELTGGAFNNAGFGVPLGESMTRVMGSNLSDLDKGWTITDLHNTNTFGVKDNTNTRVSSISKRVDISDGKKLDLTTKTKSFRLTSLGASVQLESETTESETRAATGRLATLVGRDTRRVANPLLDQMHELWKEVIKEAPEIS